MTATLEESKALSTNLNNFKQIPHLIDVDNSEVSHHRHYRHRRGDRKYFGYNHSDREQICRRERAYDRHGTHSLPHHKKSSLETLNYTLLLLIVA